MFLITGVITYANEEIKNTFTTLADNIRVAEDFGKIRFQFLMFHRPIFGMKGSISENSLLIHSFTKSFFYKCLI